MTRVTLQLDVDPDGPVDNIGDGLGLVGRRAKGDLKRFKEFIEGRGVETGAWRGTVAPTRRALSGDDRRVPGEPATVSAARLQ